MSQQSGGQTHSGGQSSADRRRRSWFSGFAAVVILGGIGLFAALVLRSNKSFPPLGVGAYVGQISGATSPDGEYRTFYVERIPGSQALLFVIFSDGWRPQFVPMERLFEQLSSADLTEDVALQPVTLQIGNKTAVLSGKKDFNHYSGDVTTSDGQKGIWNLRPVKPEDLSGGASDDSTLNELREWLMVKATYTDRRKQLKEATVRLEQNKEKLRKLQKFITQEDLLRERAQERKKTLTAELETAEKGRDDGVQKIAGLVSELELLGRISKRGKAINLARKVAARENKWYLVNWGAAEDVAALESDEAAAPSIDMTALDEEYKSAQEKRALQRELADERKRITELQARLSGASPDDSGVDATAPTYNATEEQPAKKTESKNLWDKLWGE